jgi:hypothetical protein
MTVMLYIIMMMVMVYLMLTLEDTYAKDDWNNQAIINVFLACFHLQVNSEDYH